MNLKFYVKMLFSLAFRTHSLRKTFGYHQIKRGTNITLLMNMFNHSSEIVTLRYIGITQDDMDAAVQALNL